MLKFFRQKPIEQSDAALLAAYQSSGDLSLLTILYERYVALVYGVCLKYFKDEILAEDAVMNIYEELIIKVKKHQIENFRAWLSVLARNHCLMQLRKRKHEISYDPQLMYSQEFVHPFFEETEGNEAQLKKLVICIDKLPSEQQRCVRWFYLENKSYRDIVELSSLELGKVRSYIQNGRRNLRICMGAI